MDGMKDTLISVGMSAAQAYQMAVAQAYPEMLRQASMLSYHNAFLLLSVTFSNSPNPSRRRSPG